MPRIRVFQGGTTHTAVEPIDDKMVAGLAWFEGRGRFVSVFRLIPSRLAYRARSHARYHLARVMAGKVDGATL